MKNSWFYNFAISGLFSSVSVMGAAQASWTDVEGIIQTYNCTFCHNPEGPPTKPGSPAGGMDLTEDPYAAWVNMAANQKNAKAAGLMRVKPNDPDNSLLYLKISHKANAKDYGSNMPPGEEAEQVTDEDVQLVKNWILAGAPKGEFTTSLQGNQANSAQKQIVFSTPYLPGSPILIHQNLSSEAVASIHRVDGSVLRNLAVESQGNFATLIWDGRDGNGKPASRGRYVLVVSKGKDALQRPLILAH